MIRLIERFKYCFEVHAFGVCAYIGEKLGIASSIIRLFFIYATFITAGSPIIIYLILAFFLKLKERFFKKRVTIWDL